MRQHSHIGHNGGPPAAGGSGERRQWGRVGAVGGGMHGTEATCGGALAPAAPPAWARTVHGPLGRTWGSTAGRCRSQRFQTPKSRRPLSQSSRRQSIWGKWAQGRGRRGAQSEAAGTLLAGRSLRGTDPRQRMQTGTGRHSSSMHFFAHKPSAQVGCSQRLAHAGEHSGRCPHRRRHLCLHHLPAKRKLHGADAAGGGSGQRGARQVSLSRSWQGCCRSSGCNSSAAGRPLQKRVLTPKTRSLLCPARCPYESCCGQPQQPHRVPAPRGSRGTAQGLTKVGTAHLGKSVVHPQCSSKVSAAGARAVGWAAG